MRPVNIRFKCIRPRNPCMGKTAIVTLRALHTQINIYPIFSWDGSARIICRYCVTWFSQLNMQPQFTRLVARALRMAADEADKLTQRYKGKEKKPE